tara:strand:- start:528 stop:755 length:228 start_codon:yes stop_codon:yes gene_type:complete
MMIQFGYTDVMEALELYLSKQLGAKANCYEMSDVSFEHSFFTSDENGSTDMQTELLEFGELDCFTINIEEVNNED